METATTGLSVFLVAYLAGSIPFGYLTARLVSGEDIRQLGSGNIGATNVARILGARWGLAVLVLDACKGGLPVWGVPLLMGLDAGDGVSNWRVLGGLSAVVGHMFPIWLKFRGGKGVATALGVVLVLGWQATAVAAVVFLMVVLATRLVALGSILAAVSFAVAQIWLLASDAEPGWESDRALVGFSVLVPLLIMVRHRTNIARMLRGSEPRFKAGAGRDAAVSESEA
ncbi:MAG: glycerol-3-phosphate 1-O-acyltransferase PlsY, partial [Planctomycetaceae bacterium]